MTVTHPGELSGLDLYEVWISATTLTDRFDPLIDATRPGGTATGRRPDGQPGTHRQPEQEGPVELTTVDAQAGHGAPALLRSGGDADAVHVPLAHPERGVGALSGPVLHG